MNSQFSSIIVNADDYGLTPDTNRAISELAGLRAISSTSLMLNRPDVEQVVELCQYKTLGLGVHVNLTTGKPLTSVPSLTNEDGIFLSLSQLVAHIRQGKVNAKEIRAEIEAQMNKARALVGDQLDHWDSHEGVHRYEPVATIAMRVAHQHGLIGMRAHRHLFVLRAKPLRAELPGLKYGAKRMLREAYYTFLSLRGRRYFAMPRGLLYLQNGKTLDVLHMLSEYGTPVGQVTYELPCHPAASFTGLTAEESKIPRVAEYEFLKSSTWLEVVQSGRVRLTTFRGLGNKG